AGPQCADRVGGGAGGSARGVLWLPAVSEARPHRQQRIGRPAARRRYLLMRALLDVNVLIALLDADHSLHGRATEWFAANAEDGWASCPITQNGCVRIMSHPGYPNALPVRAVVERLAEAAAGAHHDFWPDDVSLLDPQIADAARIHGPRQLTDI